MTTLYVKTTDTCNLNCSHCFTNGRSGTKTQWDATATSQWIRDYITQHAISQYHIELHGGEPMLVGVDRLEAFCSSLEDLPHLSVGITTNLVYKLYPEMLTFFKQRLKGRVGTSWDRGIRFENTKQYELWLRNVRTLVDHGIHVVCMVSVSTALVDQPVEQFVEEFARTGIQEIALERITSSGLARHDPSIFPDPNDQDLWYLALLKRYQLGLVPFAIRDFDILIERLNQNVTSTYNNCRTCEQDLVTISANGQLAGCPNSALDVSQGSIQDPAISLQYHPARIEQMAVEKTPHPDCLGCDVYSYCGGDCHRLDHREGRCGGLYHVLNYLVHGIEPTTARTRRRMIPIRSEL